MSDDRVQRIDARHPSETPVNTGTSPERSESAGRSVSTRRSESTGRSAGVFEPWLVVFAAPLLLLSERLPAWAPPLGLAWIGLLWAARRARIRRWSARTILDAPVLALLCTLPGAVFVAADQGAAMSRAYSLLFAIALAYGIANGVVTARRAWFAAVWMMIAGLALSALALVSVDWLIKYPALEPTLSRLPRLLDTIPHATLGVVPGTPSVGVHPNTVAGLLVLFIPLAFACALARRRPEDAALGAPPIVRGVAIATLLGGVPVLILTQSRGALLGLLVSFAVLLAARARDMITTPSALRRHGGPVGGILAAVGVIGALTAVVLFGLQSDRPEHLPEQGGGAWFSPSAAGRFQLWQDGLAMIAEAPLTGIGLHNFPLEHGALPEYDAFIYKGFAHVHNQLLQAALDFGLPGLVAVVGLYVSVGWAIRRIRRHTRGGAFDPLIVGLALGLLAHAVHGLVDAVAIGAKPGFIPWAMVGLVAAIRLRIPRWSKTKAEGGDPMGDLGADDTARIIGAPQHTLASKIRAEPERPR